MPPGTFHRSHKLHIDRSHLNNTTALLFFPRPGGPSHVYSSSPSNGCTSYAVSCTKPLDRNPYASPAAPPVPLFAHRLRFACSPVRPLGLDFDTLSCTCSLVVRSPFICLSSISFGRAAHEPETDIVIWYEGDIWIYRQRLERSTST